MVEAAITGLEATKIEPMKCYIILLTRRIIQQGDRTEIDPPTGTKTDMLLMFLVTE